MFVGDGSKLEFKRSHARLLRQQSITETEPGPILHDFEALLGYVRERALRVTGTHQLPLSCLPEINARLHRPLDLGLKRPQQKSYPPIHGLYLLLRASGLTYLDHIGSKPSLMVDGDLAASWETLNPTERYGTLLETWLLRAHPDIVGERPRPFYYIPENFLKWMNLFARPDDRLDFLAYTPGWHNLGLLALFGLVEIEEGPSVAGEGWQIAGLQLTLFGEALLTLLCAEFFLDFDRILDLEAEEEIPPGTLQSVLGPYFPMWQRTLPLPAESPFREGLHIFKVSLGKRLWRRLAVPARATLEQLAGDILDAYDFDYDHLYDFRYENRLGVEQRLYHPYMDEGPWVSDVQVGALPLHVNQAMTFLYDYGDRWEFEVTLEEIQPTTGEAETRVLEAAGDAPEQYPGWT